jgi:hypothetical protein
MGTAMPAGPHTQLDRLHKLLGHPDQPPDWPNRPIGILHMQPDQP